MTNEKKIHSEKGATAIGYGRAFSMAGSEAKESLSKSINTGETERGTPELADRLQRQACGEYLISTLGLLVDHEPVSIQWIRV